MEYKIKPFNYWGDSFWGRHFKVFGFIKLFFSQFIDFLQDKMHSPELSAFIAGFYLINLNSELLGIYNAFSMCAALCPNCIEVPEYLMLESKFSRYSHHFYSLVFIGNLRKCPYFITILCALYCIYDLILVSVDVITKQTAFCRHIHGSTIYVASLTLYAYFRFCISCIISINWVIVLLLPRHIVREVQFFSYGGKLFNFLLIKIFRCQFFRNYNKLLRTPFKYPLRIKCAGIIALGLCSMNALFVLYI